MTTPLDPTKRLHRLRGLLRLAFGFCPRCNSDAPAKDFCSVCESIHVDEYPTIISNNLVGLPNTATRGLWWYKFVHPSSAKMQGIKNKDMSQKFPNHPCAIK